MTGKQFTHGDPRKTDGVEDTFLARYQWMENSEIPTSNMVTLIACELLCLVQITRVNFAPLTSRLRGEA